MNYPDFNLATTPMASLNVGDKILYQGTWMEVTMSVTNGWNVEVCDDPTGEKVDLKEKDEIAELLS